MTNPPLLTEKVPSLERNVRVGRPHLRCLRHDRPLQGTSQVLDLSPKASPESAFLFKLPSERDQINHFRPLLCAGGTCAWENHTCGFCVTTDRFRVPPPATWLLAWSASQR